MIADLRVSWGQMLMSGHVVLTLADVDQLRPETTDLSDRGVVTVRVGQEATVHAGAQARMSLDAAPDVGGRMVCNRGCSHRKVDY